jgi:hypothetical protein
VSHVGPCSKLTQRKDRRFDKACIRWHLGAPRQIQRGQLIHESVFDKIAKDDSYRPKARLYGNLDWNSVDDLRALVEVDPYTNFVKLLEEIQNPMFNVSDQQLDTYLNLINSGK